MAKLKDGIFGPASGSIGNVIISSRNGVPYIRSKPAKVHNPRTPKQLAAREKLTLLNRILCKLKPVIAVGFPDRPAGKSARDAAYSENYPKAFMGTYPDIALNYPLLTVSKGKLAPAEGVSSNLEGDKLSVTWKNSSDGANHDLAILAAYNAAADQIAYNLRAAERRTGQARLDLPESMTRDQSDLHCWIFFTSPDGGRCSESIYVRVGD